MMANMVHDFAENQVGSGTRGAVWVNRAEAGDFILPLGLCLTIWERRWGACVKLDAG
ncbi:MULTISPECIES: hypothetical protein [Sphingobium]|uniref:hypothetical protein n=1 Tax=Sphingobium TaxID=165695 RepID=UPI00146FEF80|nr:MULTISPECIES: hypothetical protein [Sphingobium]